MDKGVFLVEIEMFGFQFGIEDNQLLMLIMTEKGLNALSVASQWEGENDMEPAVPGEEAMA